MIGWFIHLDKFSFFLTQFQQVEKQRLRTQYLLLVLLQPSARHAGKGNSQLVDVAGLQDQTTWTETGYGEDVGTMWTMATDLPGSLSMLEKERPTHRESLLNTHGWEWICITTKQEDGYVFGKIKSKKRYH